MSLYPRYYELKICPVCRELVEEDYEDGTHHHHRGYWGDIEPVTVEIPVPEQVEMAIRSELVQSALKEKIAKEERRDAQMDWWRSLPQEEQDRREAERRTGLSPMALAMETMLMAEKPLLSRMLWSDAEIKVEPGTAVPTTKEGD